MTYRFGYMAFVVSSVGECDLGTCGCKGKLLEWLWMRAGCRAAIASACARCGNLRDGLPRGAVGLRPSAGRGNSVGFGRNCN